MIEDGAHAGTSQVPSRPRRRAREDPEPNDDMPDNSTRNARQRLTGNEVHANTSNYPVSVSTPHVNEVAEIQRGRHASGDQTTGANYFLDIDSFCRTGRPCKTLLDLTHEDEKFEFIGEKLFYLRENDSDEQKVKCRTFLKAYFDHLVNNRIMLVEGRAGSGKTTLVEQIAMMFISEANNHNNGYLIVTNGCNTLTEQRLFRYMHNGQEYLGPLSKMIQDAREHLESRYVFILHEWNRVSDFMSLLGNFFEEELRAYGPDSWQEMEDNRDDWEPHTFQGNVGQATASDDLYSIPSNFRIILTGNPCRDDFMGETADFMVDPALNANRLVGAHVTLEASIYSLEDNGKYPCDSIERNLRLKLLEGHTEAIIDSLLDDIKKKFNQNANLDPLIRNRILRRGIMPGKLVAVVKRRIKELEVQVSPSTFLFHTSSDSYNFVAYLEERLRLDTVIQFGIKAHHQIMRPHDTVFFRRTGGDRTVAQTIFARGHIVEGPSPPSQIIDDGLNHWKIKSNIESEKTLQRVRIKLSSFWGQMEGHGSLHNFISGNALSLEQFREETGSPMLNNTPTRIIILNNGISRQLKKLWDENRTPIGEILSKYITDR